jgi:hypothetical protein
LEMTVISWRRLASPKCSRIIKVTDTIPPFTKPPNILRSNCRHKHWLIVNIKRGNTYSLMKKAAQKTKQIERYKNYSNIVSNKKHQFSRVSDPCFKSISKSQRSARCSGGTGGHFGGRLGSTKKSIGHGKDLTGVQGYLRTVEGQTSLTFWLYSGSGRTTRTNIGVNSKGRIFTNKRNQKKPFGAKAAKNKSYKKIQKQKNFKVPSWRNKLTSGQKKNFGKVLLPYFGKQIV